MTENSNMNEDKLLQKFFAEHRKDIADEGFTRRVIQRLPAHKNRTAQIWTFCCSVLTLVAFVALDGVHLLGNALMQALRNTVNSGIMDIDPKAMLLAAVILVYLECSRITSRA